MYSIQKMVPIPGRRGKSVYPFADMKVGDSFAVPKSRKAQVASAASYWAKRHAGFAFVTRVVADEMRIWRVKA